MKSLYLEVLLGKVVMPVRVIKFQTYAEQLTHDLEDKC